MTPMTGYMTHMAGHGYWPPIFLQAGTPVIVIGERDNPSDWDDDDGPTHALILAPQGAILPCSWCLLVSGP